MGARGRMKRSVVRIVTKNAQDRASGGSVRRRVRINDEQITILENISKRSYESSDSRK